MDLQADLYVTDRVFQRIEELLRQKEALFPILRITVENGGCNGFQYKYDFIHPNDIEQDDFVAEKANSKVVVDQLSLQLIKHSKIDFVEELIGSDFQITNPNATGNCGCNNSFSI